VCSSDLQASSRGRTKNNPFVIATGSQLGIYFAIGQDIARIAAAADTPIYMSVEATSGSIDNLIRIRNGTADFALLQSDIAHDSLAAGDTTFSILASLYTETIQICVRRSLYLMQPGDLRGKRISIGLSESGTYPNAIAVLEAAGLTVNDIQAEYLSPDSSLKALKAGAIDAAFFTAGVPHREIADLIKDGKAYLLGLDARTIKRLVEQDPNFVLSDVPSKAYPGQNKSVQTVGVRACLACANGRVDRQTVLGLLQAVYHPSDSVDIRVSGLRSLDVINGIVGVARDDLHPDAVDYYEGENAFFWKDVWSWVREYNPLAIIICIPVILYFLHRRTSLTAFIYRNTIHLEVAKILGWVFVILFLTGALLFVFEHGVNGDFGNLWNRFGPPSCT
jgi:TRAP transporter TAXI family solute receptor